MDSLKTKGKRVLESIEEKRNDILHKWEDKSREFIGSFLLLFGREGRLSNIWNEGRGRIMKALSPPPSPNRIGYYDYDDDDDDNEEVNGIVEQDADEDDDQPPRKTPRLSSKSAANSSAVSPDCSFHSANDISQTYSSGNYSDDD
jgi:choline-phosphate cytidylyltransferase